MREGPPPRLSGALQPQPRGSCSHDSHTVQHANTPRARSRAHTRARTHVPRPPEKVDTYPGCPLTRTHRSRSPSRLSIPFPSGSPFLISPKSPLRPHLLPQPRRATASPGCGAGLGMERWLRRADTGARGRGLGRDPAVVRRSLGSRDLAGPQQCRAWGAMPPRVLLESSRSLARSRARAPGPALRQL
jgi:hypothetical protein